LTEKQREKILEMKELAVIGETKHGDEQRDVEQLSKAFMKLIDCIGVDGYRSRNLSKNGLRHEPNYKIFSPGELGVITKYLKRKKLIKEDKWGRYIVKWRE